MIKTTHNEDFLSGIIKTMFLIRSIVHQKGEAKPMSFLRTVVLRYVKEHKDPKVKDIAFYLDITMPSASSLIDDLVKLGFLKKSEDPDDRRSTRLILTPPGEKAVCDKLKAIEKNMRMSLSILTPSEQKQLFQMMQKIYKNLAERYRAKNL